MAKIPNIKRAKEEEMVEYHDRAIKLAASAEEIYLEFYKGEEFYVDQLKDSRNIFQASIYANGIYWAAIIKGLSKAMKD